MKRRIMTTQERQALNEDLATRRQALTTPDIVGISGGEPAWGAAPIQRGQHPDRESYELTRLQKIKETGEAPHLNPKERGKLDKRINELQEFLVNKQVLAPNKFFHQRKENTKDYHKTVKHIVEVESNPKIVDAMNELKNLRRIREPDQPGAGNIEHLRGT